MKILVLDDNEQDRKRLCDWIRDWFVNHSADSSHQLDGIEEHKLRAAAAASLAANGEEFGLAFISWDLKEINAGQELLLQYSKKLPELSFIVMSQQLLKSNMSTLPFQFGATDLIGKPFDRKEVNSRLAQFFTAPTIRYLTEIKKEIVGESAALMKTFKQINDAILSPKHSVLLTGETGTGKELIAQTVHLLSNTGKKLVPVALGIYPSELVADAIFGHEKGAFNEAKERRAGFLEEADGGSLFLDEIGELPLKVQADLLRALDTRRFHRLGAIKETSFDVRLICATNRDLKSAIEARQFRDDLFYRINTLPIHIPPLRERREDIPLLLNHFLAKFSAGRSIGIDRAARSILESHDFPGNVRELSNIVEAAVAKCGEGNEILPQHITELLRLEIIQSSQLNSSPIGFELSTLESEPQPETEALPAPVPASSNGGEISIPQEWLNLPYRDAHEQVAQRFNAIYLAHHLNKHRYVVSKAATSIGIDRKTFTQHAERAGLLLKPEPTSSPDEPHEKEELS